MIRGRRDTIAAVATPVGVGGIGIVRISGKRALEIVSHALTRRPDQFPDRTLIYDQLKDSSGEIVDDVLAVVFRSPRSYTGEDVAEIHGHGGAVNLARVLGVVTALGARHAEPGEFTRRAFENGRLDLVQAEAIAGVIEAQSERAWRLAQAQLAGRLGTQLEAFSNQIAALLADVEARIDFPEEGVEFAPRETLRARAGELRAEIGRLADTFRFGRALRDGIDVAIVGPINGGKSSLFNMLLDEERALVDADAGTTRDYVEAKTVWQGLSVTLVDTAGIRDANSHVERRGIQMGQERSERADLEVVVHPVTNGSRPEFESGDKRQIHVVTKIDLLSSPGETTKGGQAIETSAKDRRGIDRLKREIVAVALGQRGDAGDSVAITSERQHGLLRQASVAMGVVAESAEKPLELVAIELRDAMRWLGEVLGREVDDAVLDSLFAQFCIGK